MTKQELRDIFNPDGSKLRTDQLELLKMVQHVAEICEQNGIKWWLSSGTLLGAIRHNGFIPWDDDMDIVLPHDEYNKLINILLKEENDEYVIQCHKSDENYIAVFAKYRKRKGNVSGINAFATSCYKYQGIGFDIFQLQKNSYIGAYAAAKLFKACMRYNWKIKNTTLRHIYSSISLTLFNFISKIIYYPLLIFRKNGEYHYQAGTGWPQHVFYERDFYPLRLQAFEHLSFPVPNNSDNYLKNNFGDYMQLPDLETIHIHSKEYKEEIYPRLNKFLYKK